MRVGFNRVNKRILTALIGSGAMDTFGDRKDVFNQIDTALKMLNKHWKETKAISRIFLVMKLFLQQMMFQIVKLSLIGLQMNGMHSVST